MKTIYFIFSFFILSTFLTATIINVPGDQSTIQEGINVAVDGDTVLAQPGTYVENINYDEKSITVASLFLTTQDTTYISQTIIDGNQDGSVVTFESEEDETAILTGFTIINGDEECGGGIYCDNSSPSLQNLIITGNLAFSGGGIGCFYNSNPNIENVSVTDNSAIDDGVGGGIYCSNSSPSLQNLIITGNSAGWCGGGICCLESNPSLENVIISGNPAENGGGIACIGSNPTLFDVTITGNSAWNGGGIYCTDESNLSLVNVMITDNSAHRGGGICCVLN